MPEVLTETDRDRIAAHNLDLVSAAKVDVTDEMMLLAEQLSRIHGRVRVTNEASGTHLYLPSPICLDEYGADELHKMHLAVNVSLYFNGSGDQDRCAMCMKTSTPYTVSDLLSMEPLDKRGYELKPAVLKVAKTNLESMEYDANGVLIPKSPGEVVPVYELPEDHPAQMYLRSRNYDPMMLWHQFRLSFCTKEHEGVYYRRMLNGFRASPQNRIVFFIDVGGINRGWQSRILDVVRNDVKYYYHTYTNRWIPVLKKAGEKWVPVSDVWASWDEVKYAISAGCHRNECLLGFDAAVDWNSTLPPEQRWCVLSEGPLDAGRVGIPGLSMMGKSLSPQQCKLIADQFAHVLYVKDVDKAGEQAEASVRRRFAELQGTTPPRLIVEAPSYGKDLGDMTPEDARAFVESKIYE